MANLNVSNRMVQVLGNQDAQTLVNKILTDGKVDKTDKQDLQKLEAMLKSAAEEDGTLDGEEKELMGALTNHSYVLGVNTGTSEAILLDNLKKVQQIQTQFKDMQPSEVDFEGLAITTDGFFSDEVRVIRLRDQVEAPATGSQDSITENTSGGSGSVTEPSNTASSETVDSIPAKVQYTPTTAPNAGSPQAEVPAEQSSRVETQAQAYTEAVQGLQAEVRVVRDMLNDPSQVSNAQLQNSLQSLADNDTTLALKELSRHGDVLKDMKSAGLITDADINTLTTTQSLKHQKLANDKEFGDVLSQYLKDTPLTDKQLNGYRETLVKAADNYIADPSDANSTTLRTELYDNLYVFEKGATPAQEEAYRKLSPALDRVDQKQAAFQQQVAVSTGEGSVLSPKITSADELAKNLANLNAMPQTQTENFAGQMDKVLTYLEENPNQYEGQAGDMATLKSKVNELKTLQDPEQKLMLFNELKTDLDEIYIKTNIKQGAAGISQTETLAQLENIKASTGNENTRQAVEFLLKNPELLSGAPNVSEYKNILGTLTNGPQQLTPKQQELKAALEVGDTAKVNQMYMREMLGNMGGFMGSFSGILGIGSSISNSMSSSALPEEPPLPGTWSAASDLASTLQAASPDRRAELITALQSPEASQLAQAIQESPELAQIMGRYENAQAAKNSIAQAHWNTDSDLEQAQQTLQNQQSQPAAIQAELENAQGAIDALLTKGDLSPPVAERLKAQKVSLDKALAHIKAGTFTPEIANSSEMAGLTEILQANASRTEATPPLTIEQALKKEATLHALESLKSDQPSLERLESALGDLKDSNGKSLYGHIFEKDGNGVYKFPDQMIALINDPELSSAGLDLTLHQLNRSLHVIDSAKTGDDSTKTRSVETLKANYVQGQELMEKDGRERDFFSGYMALKGLDSIISSPQEMGFRSSSDLINSVSQGGMQELLDNTSLKPSEKRAQISQLMQENMGKANKELVGKVSEEKLGEVRDTFRGIFESNDPNQQEAKNQLLAAAAKINSAINPAEITSSEQLLENLSASQITDLQTAIRESAGSSISTYPPDVQVLMEQLSPEVKYYPGMDSDGLNTQDKTLVDSINQKLTPEAISDIEKKQKANALLMGAVSQLEPLAEFRTAQSNLINRLNGSLKTMESVQTEASEDLAELAPEANTQIFGDLTPPQPGSENYLDNLQQYNAQIMQNAENYLSSDAFKGLGSEEKTTVQALVESIKTSAASSMTQIPLLHKVNSGKGLSDNERGTAELALGLAITYRNGARNIGSAAGTGNSGAVVKAQQKLEEDVNTVTTAVLTGNYDDADKPNAPEALVRVKDFNVSTENYNHVQGAMGDLIVQGVITPDQVLSEEYQQHSLLHGGTPDNPVLPTEPTPAISLEEIIESYEGMKELLVDNPPELAVQAAQTLLPLLELQVHAWDEAVESFDDFTIKMNPVMEQMGYPPLDTSRVDNPPASSLSAAPVGSMGSMGATKADQKAADLVAKANALADRLVLAPKGADSEELLNDLVTDFLNIIRDQDYKTRQLVLAQLANQMMTDSITSFYKDKTDKNNKYHQDALASMASSFQQNIQQNIQSSLVAAASGGDAQSVAAVSGQVGAAGTAEAMSVAQLRSSTEQLLSQAQQIEPPLITNQQKDQILNSLFDDNPNNDALGIIALAGLPSLH